MADTDISQFIVPTPGDAPIGALVPPGIATAPPSRNSNGAVNAAILVLFVILLVIFLATPHTLAGKLARQGWVLYVMPGCPHCAVQERYLGPSVYRKKVICVEGRGQAGGGVAIESGTLVGTGAPYGCEKVSAYPFWANQYTLSTRRGVQNVAALNRMLD